MRERLIPSGRVNYFPNSWLTDQRQIRSTTSKVIRTVRVRHKTVDATVSNTNTPESQTPSFTMEDGVEMVSPSGLIECAHMYEHFTILGGGKTSMDVCVWLLSNGAEPNQIRWIVPRDIWMENRAKIQPGNRFLGDLGRAQIVQWRAIQQTKSVDGFFEMLEAEGNLLRLDKTVKPTLYRCATISEEEMYQLRRVGDIIRGQYVAAIEPDRLTFADGNLLNAPNSLYINCTAKGLGHGAALPVFTRDRINVQPVRYCRLCHSAATIGYAEGRISSDEEKAHLFEAILPPDDRADLPKMMLADVRAEQRWQSHPDLVSWFRECRLSGRVAGDEPVPTPDIIALLDDLQKLRSESESHLKSLIGAN